MVRLRRSIPVRLMLLLIGAAAFVRSAAADGVIDPRLRLDHWHGNAPSGWHGSHADGVWAMCLFVGGRLSTRPFGRGRGQERPHRGLPAAQPA